MPGHFQIKKAINGQYYFVLKAGNNETILKSEMYVTKANAENGIASVKTNAPLDNRYERKQAVNLKWMFNLKAANNQIIGTSEQYESKTGMENGIASVKINAPSATTTDLTS